MITKNMDMIVTMIMRSHNVDDHATKDTHCDDDDDDDCYSYYRCWC